MKACLLAIICIVAVINSSEAATYYVAPTGNDAGPGTKTQPWKTLKKAASAVQPGDTVRIRAGNYSGAGFRFNRAGTESSPITYKAYGDGEVRITNSTVVPAGSWALLRDQIYYTTISTSVTSVFQNSIPLHDPGDQAGIYAVDDLIPNSFYISGTTLYVWLEDGSDPNNSVMRISPSHVIELDNCHYTVFDGLTVEYGYNGFKDQGSATHHITYRNNTIRSIRSQGIQPTPANSVIESNLFQKIGVNKFTHAIYTSKPGIIIRHNVFEEIAGAGIHLYNGSTLGGGHYHIEGNVFRKPRMMTYPTSGNRYYTDMIIWEEGSNTIINNVLYGKGKRKGISLNSPDNLVANNTFVGAVNPIAFASNQPGNQVFNNLFQHTGTSVIIAWPSNAGAQTLDSNLYFHTAGTPRWQQNGVTYTSFAAYQAVAGESQSLYADPQLASDVDAHILDGSPAIDAAIPLAEVSTDREGTPRQHGLGPDIGAYEYAYPEEHLNPVIVAHSGNFDAANPVSNLFDGCLDQVANCTAGNDGIASFWVTLDLGSDYALSRSRLFGDAAGTWTSTSWSLSVACENDNQWTEVFSHSPSLGNQWFKEELDGIVARYVRVEVFGNPAYPPGRTEARELEVYGSPWASCP
jgi:Right handed beta helix region/Chondroitinase B